MIGRHLHIARHIDAALYDLSPQVKSSYSTVLRINVVLARR